ncbi:MAG: DUF2333 family protein [Desulfobacterales bacterium]|nr:DUF2333 family protein [Desulfobacterales bacterium]
MSEKKRSNINKDFRRFALSRGGIALVAALLILWACGALFNRITADTPEHAAEVSETQKADTYGTAHAAEPQPAEAHTTTKPLVSEAHTPEPAKQTEAHPGHAAEVSETQKADTYGTAHAAEPQPAEAHTTAKPLVSESHTPEPAKQTETHPSHATETPSAHGPAIDPNAALGTAFVTAIIEPIRHELDDRSFGWRPNDVVTFFTDNIKHHQLGTLEVTRRASEKLVERIARTGSTIKFDRNLDLARTRFSNDPRKYWFPSAESAYSQAIEELETYRERLNNNKATFHARADNLIPLLSSFEDLLGDCDDDLVKTHEESGDEVSTFKADDYFYFAQGVSNAMAPILEAVMIDFAPVLDSRGATNDLHHAVLMLQHATELDPLFVQESEYSGLFANHRANMAAFISHARAYIQFVIKTMST